MVTGLSAAAEGRFSFMFKGFFMSLHPNAGKRAPKSDLVNVPELIAAYYTRTPDMGDAAQRISFGTSGHRGSSLSGSFNEAHIFAVTQAVCDYRAGAGIDGTLFMGMDTHPQSTNLEFSTIQGFYFVG